MITTLTAPACRAVSLEEARQQLRLDGDDEDLLLAAKLDAAQAELELMTGLRLCPQTLSLELEVWEDEIVVPVRPCAVTQIQYVGLSGAVVTLAASDYVVRRRHGLTRIRPTTGKVWPTLGNDGLITITLAAGFAETDPDFLIARAAILVRAASEFQNREGGACLAFDTLASQLAARWI
jgi:uncharacterized phiE125 gp8 family phage protein